MYRQNLILSLLPILSIQLMSHLFHCHILVRLDAYCKADILCPILCIVKIWFFTASYIKQSIYVVSVVLSHLGSSLFLI
jgi:hypothetical protein